MGDIVQMRQSYQAKSWAVSWEGKDIKVAGTLCGHVEMAIPGIGSIPLTPNEAYLLAAMLLASREDVLKNSRPYDDPMLIKDGDRDR